MSDFQYLRNVLDALVIEEFTAQDGHTLGPTEIHEYLTQLLYARRSEMDPLWNYIIVGGFKDGKRCAFWLLLFGFLKVLRDALQISVVHRFEGDNVFGVDSGHWFWSIHCPTAAAKGRGRKRGYFNRGRG